MKDFGTSNNPGAVCIPYYDFNLYSIETTIIKFLKSEGNWPENMQCINSDCHMVSKFTCESMGDSCVCYDTCPKGPPNYPFPLENILIPCSGRGVCRANGQCLCMHGYLPPNCQNHCFDLEGGCCKSDKEIGRAHV